MNREQIIQMARKSGIWVLDDGTPYDGISAYTFERFAAAIRAATKEEDAKICDRIHEDAWDESNADLCANAIRASNE